MDSSANTRQSDPHDVSPGLSTQEKELVACADERLAHAYEQIARADEQLARVNEQISRLEQDAARKKSVNRPRRPSHGGPALRGFIGLLLTACICIAAFVSQSHGETARLMISRWAPQLAPASSLPVETPKLAAQHSPPAVQLAAADAAASQLPPPVQTAPHEAVAAPIPPELTQLLETMARDLASVQQEVEQLKTSQEELARENVRTGEQLRAMQEQTARAIANASEQNSRPRTSAPPPMAASTRKPVSTLPPQARVQGRTPVQLVPGQQ
jgi:septal ring factor EnvC (AmiA/AmiB activator)